MQVDDLPVTRAARLRAVTEAIDEGRQKRADEEAKRQS